MDEQQLQALLAQFGEAVAKQTAPLIAEIKELKDKAVKEEDAKAKGVLVQTALAAGKIAPAMVDAISKAGSTMSVEAFKGMLEALPTLTHESPSTNIFDEGPQIPATGRDGLSSQEVALLDKHGIDVAAYKEFGEYNSYSMVTRQLTSREKGTVAKVKPTRNIKNYYGERCLARLEGPKVEVVK